MLGIGREWGIPRDSPRWRRSSSVPASTRPSLVKGGVLISPSSQTSGLSDSAIHLLYVGYDIRTSSVRAGSQDGKGPRGAASTASTASARSTYRRPRRTGGPHRL